MATTQDPSLGLIGMGLSFESNSSNTGADHAKDMPVVKAAMQAVTHRNENKNKTVCRYLEYSRENTGARVKRGETSFRKREISKGKYVQLKTKVREE